MKEKGVKNKYADNDYRDWAVTENDQVFQQAIATARHHEARRRRLKGANENILFDLLRSRLHNPR